mmetsp:Transcript_34872/g.33939  ORF Transcript_34872/g.33939 Transcript_34872/m.33939 type:complete len:172 (+) Transcript_34872:312-827(+)
MPTALTQERLEGTVKYSFRFFTFSGVIGTLFVLLAFIISFKLPAIMQSNAIGLWPILFAEIVIECNRNPDVARGLCCLPIQIKAKYYPWVLLALFSIFFGFQLSLVVGFLVGYIYIYGYLKFLDISIAKSRSWENKFPFKNFENNPSFVSITNATGASSLPTFVRSEPPSI